MVVVGRSFAGGGKSDESKYPVAILTRRRLD
jgi:hypothetical protein